MITSLELIPREASVLLKETTSIKEKFTDINAINIPDLIRFDTRSWDGTNIIKDYYNNIIPHIRAIDFDLKSDRIIDIINKYNLKEVLVIKGDLPQDMSKITYSTTSIQLMRKIKSKIPDIKVYCALDPYRSAIQDELDYVNEKNDSGCDGFFTQPFFDIRFIEIYAEYLENFNIYWGVSPVVTERSKHYWESRNRANFPKSFEPTMEWNVNFAKEAMTFCRKNNFNIYFMPIRIDLIKYLDGIFEK